MSDGRGAARWLRAMAVAGAGLTATAGMASGDGIVPVHLEGDAVPGTGRAFQTFDRPVLGADGVVAFSADLDGATSSDDIICLGTTIIAREGEIAPDAGGATFGTFEFFQTSRQVNDAGEVAFVASLVEGARTRSAVYRDLDLIAIEGGPAFDGRTWTDFGFVGVLDDGRVGFLGELDGPITSNAAIVLDGEVLFEKGGIVPGLGTTFDGIFDDIQWNGAGDLLFEGNTALPSAIDRVIMRRRANGVVELLAQEGQSIDTGKGLDALGLVEQCALASGGGWALRANLRDAPASAASIVLGADGLLAVEGNAAPGLPGVVYGDFNAVAINAHDAVAWLADLAGATAPDVDEGIFVGGRLIVTDGMPAPGLPAGTVFTDLGFEDLVLDDAGRLLFAASYTGPASGDGLFMIDTGFVGCPGDLDGSGGVGVSDLATLIAAWGPCEGGCPPDLDQDGMVGFPDLVLLLAAWGPCD